VTLLGRGRKMSRNGICGIRETVSVPFLYEVRGRTWKVMTWQGRVSSCAHMKSSCQSLPSEPVTWQAVSEALPLSFFWKVECGQSLKTEPKRSLKEELKGVKRE